MNTSHVMTRLQEVFDQVFLEPVVVRPDLSAAHVQEWDSLTHITLLVAVEKAFGIRFRAGEAERAKNVGEFAALIELRVNEKTA